MVVDNSVNCEEFLSRYWGSEPPPLSLSIACRLMLKYRSIVRLSIAYIPIGETESAQRGTIGSEPIGGDRGGFGSPFQQSAKTLERCFAVSLQLNEDVQNFAPVVDSAPEIVGPDDDPDEDLIEMLASRMLASALAYAPGVETARPKRRWFRRRRRRRAQRGDTRRPDSSAPSVSRTSPHAG